MREQHANPDVVDGAGPALVTDRRTGRRYVSPYHYERQFEVEMDHATMRLIREHGSATERFAWAFVLVFGGLIGLAGQGILHAVRFLVSDARLASIITGLILGLLIAGFATSLFWGLRGRERFKKRLIDQRLCLDCGYALIGAPTDEHGSGRCPECGKTFSVARYLRPPKRYHRVAKR